MKLKERRARTVRIAEDVGLDHAPECFRRQVLEAAKQQHGGAVDPSVNAAEGIDCCFAKFIDRGKVPDIEWLNHCQGTEGATFVRGSDKSGFVSRRQSEAGALPRKKERRCSPDAAGGAGNDHHRSLTFRQQVSCPVGCPSESLVGNSTQPREAILKSKRFSQAKISPADFHFRRFSRWWMRNLTLHRSIT